MSVQPDTLTRATREQAFQSVREISPHHCFWYAVHTRSRCEKAVATQLRMRGFQSLLPLYATRRQWSDRIKLIDLPLFDGYVFGRFNRFDLPLILSAPGVAKVVGFGGGPTPIPELEIVAIQQLIASGVPATPWPFGREGERVKVCFGPLAGVRGRLQRVKDALRIVISVEMLQRSVAVEVPSEFVVPA